MNALKLPIWEAQICNWPWILPQFNLHHILQTVSADLQLKTSNFQWRRLGWLPQWQAERQLDDTFVKLVSRKGNSARTRSNRSAVLNVCLRVYMSIICMKWCQNTCLVAWETKKSVQSLNFYVRRIWINWQNFTFHLKLFLDLVFVYIYIVQHTLYQGNQLTCLKPNDGQRNANAARSRIFGRRHSEWQTKHHQLGPTKAQKSRSFKVIY